MDKIKDKRLKYVKLKDYKPLEYSIPEIYLNIIINNNNNVIVISELNIIKENEFTNKIILKGKDIVINKIFLNSIELNKNSYQKKEDELCIKKVINKKNILRIESSINPLNNTSLLGMYESNGIITTQCEAEGFRKICFHPDRPDILSKYTVRIEADREKYPVLLSNGNYISSSLLKNNRHEIIWKDPFPKPSYLFALVAGKLKCVEENYYTKTNREVTLRIYVEKGDETFVQHAINSLKKAMRWDEDIYNLEYDLNLFNIVAIRHFNMGAMENKSLNIFNSKLVLANEETTTDEEFERIEGVIAHEYFHNWTGNRITCRDWFQLSLKEGLTVYRDQQFTSDVHNYEIKRIEDVKFLRKYQFREDLGPTSHSVQPEKYLEIDNFYTTTIYEKGSEIIRMANTILGQKKFKSGFDEFIKRYDGKAATIDNFIDCLFKNYKKINPQKFKLWYKKKGTPKVTIKREWDSINKKLLLSISQTNKKHGSLIIPINIAVFTGKKKFKKYNFILKHNKEKLIIEDLKTKLNKPVVTYFRKFSAPVIWETDTTYDEEIFIVENEKDLFTIYDSTNRLYKYVISKRLINKPEFDIENKLINSFKKLLNKNSNINYKLLSELITIPCFSDLESSLNNIDPHKIYKISSDLYTKFGGELKIELYEKLKEIEKNIYQKWPKGNNERKLIEVIWKLLLHSNDLEIRQSLINYIDNNMTLSKSVLNVFIGHNCIEREIVSSKFFNKWNNNSIVLDSWFYFMASLNVNNSLEHIENLFCHKHFDPKSPNTLRSILNGFVTNNPFFHDKDGRGYHYIAKKIIQFDKVNPIIISRFIKIFSRWNEYAEPYKSNMYKEIKYIKTHSLSLNTTEVIELIYTKKK
mgnify:CR=1 FL=1